MNGNYFFDSLKRISIFDIESDETSTKRQRDNSLIDSFPDLIGYTKDNSSHLSCNNSNVLPSLSMSDDANNSRIHPFSDNIINQIDDCFLFNSANILDQNSDITPINSINEEQKLYDPLSLISGERYEAPSGFDILGYIPSIPSIINTDSTNSITPPSSTLNLIDNHTDLLSISHRLAQNSYINPINSDYDLLNPSKSNHLNPRSEVDRVLQTLIPEIITPNDTMELMGYKTNPMESLVPFYSEGNQLLPSFENTQSNANSDMWLPHIPDIPDISFARYSIKAYCLFEPEEEKIRLVEDYIKKYGIQINFENQSISNMKTIGIRSVIDRKTGLIQVTADLKKYNSQMISQNYKELQGKGGRNNLLEEKIYYVNRFKEMKKKNPDFADSNITTKIWTESKDDQLKSLSRDHGRNTLTKWQKVLNKGGFDDLLKN